MDVSAGEFLRIHWSNLETLTLPAEWEVKKNPTSGAVDLWHKSFHLTIPASFKMLKGESPPKKQMLKGESPKQKIEITLLVGGFNPFEEC